MDLVVVDCQNDFINGSLACSGAEEAIENIDKFIKEHKGELRVFYTADFHPANHMSFKAQGGIWPPHCVKGTEGAEIHKILRECGISPGEDNTYLKGQNQGEEQYSGYDGINAEGERLKDVLSDEVCVVGIASEYCVRNTVLDLLRDGKKVIVYKNMLGYVDKEEHLKNLEELKDMGVEIR